MDKKTYTLDIIRAANFFGSYKGVFLEKKEVEEYVNSLDFDNISDFESKELTPNRVAIRLLDEKIERLRCISGYNNREKCKDVNISAYR